jgi:hypothetical protein
MQAIADSGTYQGGSGARKHAKSIMTSRSESPSRSPMTSRCHAWKNVNGSVNRKDDGSDRDNVAYLLVSQISKLAAPGPVVKKGTNPWHHDRVFMEV